MPLFQDDSPVEAHVYREVLERVDSLQEEVNRLKAPSLSFTVGQYNLLAGYLGNNTEPWFLYGVDMPPERREQVSQKHQQRGPDGRPVNEGWPAYVQGILSEEEIAEVERINTLHFSWDTRQARLMTVIKNMKADILSLVECDNFEDFFKKELDALGYDCLWEKRPRNASKDGCCVAWRRSAFDLVASTVLQYVDREDPVSKKIFKDRVALCCALKSRHTGATLCFTSTHLCRNPECVKSEMVRARQIAQLTNFIDQFMQEHNFQDRPLLLAGDMNARCLGRLVAAANLVTMVLGDEVVNPFSFDVRLVPTTATSVTTARNVKIDALLYNCQNFEIAHLGDMPELSPQDPLPNAEHPSDHIPVVAQFRIRPGLDKGVSRAMQWYLTVSDQVPDHPLTLKHLRDAFAAFDFDGTGVVTPADMKTSLTVTIGVYQEDDLEKVVSQVPKEGMGFASFVDIYRQGIVRNGVMGMQKLFRSFEVFDSNSDGQIDITEFLVAAENLLPGLCASDGRLRTFFAEVDTDNSGSISLQEFDAALLARWDAVLLVAAKHSREVVLNSEGPGSSHAVCFDDCFVM